MYIPFRKYLIERGTRLYVQKRNSSSASLCSAIKRTEIIYDCATVRTHWSYCVFGFSLKILLLL